MKDNNIYKYVESKSKYAKERGYSGYIINPDNGRQWVSLKDNGPGIVADKNRALLAHGAMAHSFLMSNPGIIHLIMAIVNVLQVIGMTLTELYLELQARATPYVLGVCLDEYSKYVWDQYRAGNRSEAYATGVDYWNRRLPLRLRGMNLSQLNSDKMKLEMSGWTRKDGTPLSKCSLRSGRRVYSSAVTIITKMKPEHNPFNFAGFEYEPSRGYLSVDDFRLQLQWWATNEARNLAYFLHRAFCGRRAQELIGSWTFDPLLSKNVWTHTILNKHLKHEEGITRVDKTKTKTPQVTYWPPAMQAWMKLAPKGGANESIMGLGVISGKPINDMVVDDLLHKSWRECFPGRPYIRNWPRHTAATYAAAVFGVDIAAKYIGNSVAMIKRHYDGVETKKEGLRFFDSYPPDFSGPRRDIWDWWKERDNRE